MLGTVLPLLGGLALMVAISPSFTPWPVGVAAGVALAPTSVGMALKMLTDAALLDMNVGQLVVTAAFVDDILSLLGLTVLLEIGYSEAQGEPPSAWGALRPLLFAFIFCGASVVLAYPPPGVDLRHLGSRPYNSDGSPVHWLWYPVGLFPRLIPLLVVWIARFPRRAPWPEVCGGRNMAPPVIGRGPESVSGVFRELDEIVDYHLMPLKAEQRTLLGVMLVVLLIYSIIGDQLGSHLLGAFLAGMSFAWAHGALPLWQSQVKRISAWLVRFFFGATVGFAVPLRSMLNPEAFGWGMLVLLGPGLLAKAIPGVVAPAGDRGVVAAAMAGRGEFAFLVAQSARQAVLNPAPAQLASNLDAAAAAGALVSHSDGSYSLAATAARRLSEAAATVDAGVWCLPSCPGDNPLCDQATAPVPGVTYWRANDACDDHPDECSCASMLPPFAFSIIIWALVAASVISPVIFSFVLNRRASRSKEPLDQAAVHVEAPGNDMAPKHAAGG